MRTLPSFVTVPAIACLAADDDHPFAGGLLVVGQIPLGTSGATPCAPDNAWRSIAMAWS